MHEGIKAVKGFQTPEQLYVLIGVTSTKPLLLMVSYNGTDKAT